MGRGLGENVLGCEGACGGNAPKIFGMELSLVVTRMLLGYIKFY